MDLISFILGKKYTEKRVAETSNAIEKNSSKRFSALEENAKALSNSNINSDERVTVNSFENVIHLPKNAADGNLGAVLKGNTRLNRFTESQSLGTSLLGFGAAGSAGLLVDNAVSLFGNSSIKVDTLGTQSTPGIRAYGIRAIAGEFLTLSVYVKAPLDTVMDRLMRIGSTGTVISLEAFVATGKWQRISVSAQIPTDENDINLFIRRGGATGVDTIFHVDGFLAETGSELKPFISGGIKNTLPQRVKSVGKNVFNGKLELGIYDTGTGQKIANNDSIRNVDLLRVKAGNYRISGLPVTTGDKWGIVYDENLKAIGTKYVGAGGATSYGLTVAVDGFFSFYLIGTKELIQAIQIEFSTLTTPFEPYTETEIYLPSSGKSLPNGVADSVSDEGVHIQEVGYVQFTGANTYEGIRTALTHHMSSTDYYSVMTNFQIGTANTNEIIKNDGRCYSPQRPKFISWPGTLPNEECIWFSGPTSWGIVFSKVRVGIIEGDSHAIMLTKTQAYLATYPIELFYMKSRKVDDSVITTQLSYQGSLISKPSGTAYTESATSDDAFYTTNLVVGDSTLPIYSLDKVIKYDQATGAETYLDVSKAVIAADKLSFTHPGLVLDDLVWWSYEYPGELSTSANKAIGYFDSRYAVLDSVNGKVYKWEITSANGAPTVVLTEII